VTLCLEGRCSIQLSYGRACQCIRNTWPLELYKGLWGVGHQKVSILKMFWTWAANGTIAGFEGDLQAKV